MRFERLELRNGHMLAIIALALPYWFKNAPHAVFLVAGVIAGASLVITHYEDLF